MILLALDGGTQNDMHSYVLQKMSIFYQTKEDIMVVLKLQIDHI